jgi:hypothetical protein
MEIRLVGAALFHAVRRRERQSEGQRDRYDEDNSRFSQFFKFLQKLLFSRYGVLKKGVSRHFTLFLMLQFVVW